MSYAFGFQIYPWLERALRLRQNYFVIYGLTLAVIALAVLLRWSMGEYVGARIPFMTFFPAIILVALIGGLWPGIVATILSTVAAWYLFIPPYFSWTLGERELVQLLLFVAVAAAMIAVVGLLDAMVERLIIQQRNIRLLLETAPNGFVLVDEGGTIKLVNSSAEKLFGYKREELIGKSVEALVPRERLDAHRRVRASYQERPEVRVMGLGRDLSGQRKDGSEFPIEIGLNPIGHDGKPGVLATVIDISARKKAEEYQHLVIGELEHRTRNVFAVIQAIIRNSLTDTKTVAEARYVLKTRVEALSRAYAILAEAAWQGASLGEILDRQLIVHSKRVTVDGCDIVITPRAAQQFALIIHELSTNALKHGALSAPEGRVAISGSIDQRNGAELFMFSWKESGGPRVFPPTRKGFGSAILLESAEQFGTHVTLDYAPEGVNYQLQVALKEIAAPKNTRTQPNAPTVYIQSGSA